MDIYHKVRSYIIVFLLVFMGTHISFAQSNPSAQSHRKAQVKKEIRKDNFTLTFQNIIGKNNADFERFESKVMQAGFSGLIEVNINPKSNQMIAVFSSQTKENSLRIFFKAVGYSEYQIIK